MRKLFFLASFVFVVILSNLVLLEISAEKNIIPTWIKNTARWWSDDKVSDVEYINSIKYLIEQKIIKIQSSSSTDTKASQSQVMTNPNVETDKKVYQQGENIVIKGSGFKDGFVSVGVANDRFAFFVDRTWQNVNVNRTGIGELSGLLSYPFLEAENTGKWKEIKYDVYGTAYLTNAKVDKSGTWSAILNSSQLLENGYDIRVGQKIFDEDPVKGYKILSLRTAKTYVTVESPR